MWGDSKAITMARKSNWWMTINSKSGRCDSHKGEWALRITEKFQILIPKKQYKQSHTAMLFMLHFT